MPGPEAKQIADAPVAVVRGTAPLGLRSRLAAEFHTMAEAAKTNPEFEGRVPFAAKLSEITREHIAQIAGLFSTTPTESTENIFLNQTIMIPALNRNIVFQTRPSIDEGTYYRVVVHHADDRQSERDHHSFLSLSESDVAVVLGDRTLTLAKKYAGDRYETLVISPASWQDTDMATEETLLQNDGHQRDMAMALELLQVEEPSVQT